MKNKIKIYLDTSVISALFDERNPERKSLTKNFFDIIEVFDPYLSELTIAEIEKTPYEDLKDRMIEFIDGFAILI